jgi:hypothetical protein
LYSIFGWKLNALYSSKNKGPTYNAKEGKYQGMHTVIVLFGRIRSFDTKNMGISVTKEPIRPNILLHL